MNAENDTTSERLLAVDIGNSNVVLGVFVGDELHRDWRLTTVARRTTDEVRIYLRQLFELGELDPQSIDGVVLASVVPPLTAVYIDALRELLGVEALVLDFETPIGLTNAYRNPAEVGADRLANAVGGKLRHGLPLIIVDFGTAITLDVISAENAYQGGVILPGLELASNALHQHAAQLPQISVRKPKRLIGVSTEMSMRSGLYYGMLGAIDSLIERIRAELGIECRAIATGGSGRDIAAASRHIEDYEPHLTLHGLREIHRLNQNAD